MRRFFPFPLSPSHPRIHRPLASQLLAVGALILISVASASGDIPTSPQLRKAANCYCPCHESTTRRGCTKMCDSHKSAVRWLTVSCMKPRFQPKNDKANAGPHLRHPDRAEHARLQQPN